MCFSYRKTPFVPTEYLPAEKKADYSLGGMVTRVAYLKRIVAGARRMWLKTEAMVPPTSLPWSPGMSDARSCRKRKNQTLLVSKECEMLIKDVITYF